MIRRAIALDARNPAYHSNLGAALSAPGRPRESIACCPGMPAAAIAAGAVREVTQPAEIACRLNGWFALTDVAQCSLLVPG